MKKFKKMMAGLMAVTALTVSITSLGANAIETSAQYRTPAMITGQQCKTPTISIASSSNVISSGDFGVWWYGGGVGLDTRFVRSASRCVHIELYEADAGGTDILTKKQTAFFQLGSDGVYGAYGFSDQNIVTNTIVETDGIAEIYMKLNVDYIPGDTTRNIPTGLMVYEYWIE